MVRLRMLPILSFSEEYKVGTFQPHDDALVVTLRIGGYDVKRVLIDQEIGAKIMYPNLYKGLNPRQSVSYRTGWYGRYFPYRCLKRYKNIHISYRFKCRQYRERFGYTGRNTRFWSENGYRPETKTPDFFVVFHSPKIIS